MSKYYVYYFVCVFKGISCIDITNTKLQSMKKISLVLLIFVAILYVGCNEDLDTGSPESIDMNDYSEIGTNYIAALDSVFQEIKSVKRSGNLNDYFASAKLKSVDSNYDILEKSSFSPDLKLSLEDLRDVISQYNGSNGDSLTLLVEKLEFRNADDLNKEDKQRFLTVSNSLKSSMNYWSTDMTKWLESFCIWPKMEGENRSDSSVNVKSSSSVVTITGTISLADTGEPMSGVVAHIKYTSIGTVSDFLGHYRLMNNPGFFIIQYSMVGFITLEYGQSFGEGEWDIDVYMLSNIGLEKLNGEILLESYNYLIQNIDSLDKNLPLTVAKQSVVPFSTILTELVNEK